MLPGEPLLRRALPPSLLPDSLGCLDLDGDADTVLRVGECRVNNFVLERLISVQDASAS